MVIIADDIPYCDVIILDKTAKYGNTMIIHRNYFGGSQFLCCDQHFYYYFHYQLQITFPVLLYVFHDLATDQICCIFYDHISIWLSFARSDFWYLLWLQWSNRRSHIRYYHDHIYLFANDHQKSGAIITLIVIFQGPWLQDHISGIPNKELSTPAKRCVKLRVLEPPVCTAPLHPWNFFECGLFFLIIPKPIYSFDGTTIDELVDEDQDGACASQKIDNGKTKALKPGESLASG